MFWLLVVSVEFVVLQSALHGVWTSCLAVEVYRSSLDGLACPEVKRDKGASQSIGLAEPALGVVGCSLPLRQDGRR